MKLKPIRSLVVWLAIGTVFGIDIFRQTETPGSRVLHALLGGFSVAILGRALATALRNRFDSESPSGTVVDARGRPTRVIHAESLAIGAFELPAQLRSDVRRAGLPHMLTKLSWPSRLLLGPAVTLVTTLAVAYGGGGNDRVAAVFCAVTGVLIFASARNRLPVATVAVYLKHSHCPGCGYDLKSLVPAGDGCTVCPECGAA